MGGNEYAGCEYKVALLQSKQFFNAMLFSVKLNLIQSKVELLETEQDIDEYGHGGVSLIRGTRKVELCHVMCCKDTCSTV